MKQSWLLSTAVSAAVSGAALVVLAGPARAEVPFLMPLQGVVLDNAGEVVPEGTFAVTISLYESPTAVNAVWTESWPPAGLSCTNTPASCVQVEGGAFSIYLGTHKPLPASVFKLFKELWIGIKIETDPELPRRRLATTAYAFHASSAATADVALAANGLACTACVDLNEMTASTVNKLTEIALDAVADAGYSTDAAGLSYDPTLSGLEATSVQEAIDALHALIETTQASTDVNEGAGVVRSYSNSWDIGPFGTASEYVHMLNPAKPKVVAYLYGDTTSSLATGNNLAVAYSFAPNQYSSGVNGNKGDTVIQVLDSAVFNPGSHILLYQTVSPSGTGAGTWELNAVKTVEGSTVQLVKPLLNTYVDSGPQSRAQAVVAASYNNLEVVSGGNVLPSQGLGHDGRRGGVVYVRAQKITVRAGGKIQANAYGFMNAGGQFPGDSECQVEPPSQCTLQGNCSGGGGCGQNCNCAGGGGGNKTKGNDGTGCSCSYGTPVGGAAKGVNSTSFLTMGGAGGHGYCWYQGGTGGGLVVIGAASLEVEPGGVISANGGNADGWGGGGAGGTVAVFAENLVNEGTIEAKGGTSPSCNGHGGEGWVHLAKPIEGIVNESHPKHVQLWVDGVNVTPSVGDPNGKGLPHYDPVVKAWGADGLHPWSTGPLDLTNVANWTLGEHVVALKELGGAGGELKAYVYVIHPFTASKVPANDTCATAAPLVVSTSPTVVSGTTEDVMGKTKATDASSAAGCGGFGGPDVHYKIDLAQRALLDVSITAAFPSKIYLRQGNCSTGNVVVCADKEFLTNPIEPGTYYLTVDSDAAAAKGDFSLTASIVLAPLPSNDTCAAAKELSFDGAGKAVHAETTLYALDQYKGLCPAAQSGGPDVVYHFKANAGQALDASVTSGFETILFVKTSECGSNGIPIACSGNGSLSIPGLGGGDYWLFVDGVKEKAWGDFTLTVNLK